MTIKEALESATTRLLECGLAAPREDAEFLVRWVLDKDRTFLLAHPEHSLSHGQQEKFHQAVKDRCRRFPLQYLAGAQEFYGRPFRVNPAVLIPRPETELVVEVSLELLASLPGDPLKVLDVGTGSGCIAVTLACESARLAVTAVDVSEEALAVARQNAQQLSCLERVEFLQGDVFEPVGDRIGFYDLIVSNPPYVEDDSTDVELSVRQFEPAQAVFAGPTGLEIYRKIFSGGRNLLKKDGRLVVELGYGVLPALKGLATAHGWQLLDCRKDLAGIPRCAVLVAAGMRDGRES